VKRISVWIDSKNESADQVLAKLNEFLARTGLNYRIVEICEIVQSEESK
jgi:hypothetical protein